MFVTEHFSWQEFCCHDGAPVPEALQPEVHRLCSTVLEPLRQRWGSPLVLISGYRSESYNIRVGGALHSQHLAGRAADVAPIERAATAQLAALVETMIREGALPELGGFGVYPRQGWVHLDVRNRERNAAIMRWQGKGTGSEVA
jgi:uncharacterized protein YcbK (DUF882 family)